MKRVAVVQSNYLPWRGYFDLMRDVDLFLFYDDLQYTHSDWRNRNRIATPKGSVWLTIPTGRNHGRRICDVEVLDQSWKQRHRAKLTEVYRRAPYFGMCKDILDFLYDNAYTNLSLYNQTTLRFLAARLGITTSFGDTRQYPSSGRKTERLIEILLQVGADVYLSGPKAKAYLDESQFAAAGIELRYKVYPDYPPYRQFGPQYDPFVSIIDLLMHVGPHAPKYIWAEATATQAPPSGRVDGRSMPG